MIAGALTMAPDSMSTPRPILMFLPTITAPPMITEAPSRICPFSQTLNPPLPVSP